MRLRQHCAACNSPIKDSGPLWQAKVITPIAVSVAPKPITETPGEQDIVSLAKDRLHEIEYQLGGYDRLKTEASKLRKMIRAAESADDEDPLPAIKRVTKNGSALSV